MTAPHEVVIRFGRLFDIRTSAGAYLVGISEVTVPFDNRQVAEEALAAITVTVRQVNDAGGEDYRQVIPGEVVTGLPFPRNPRAGNEGGPPGCGRGGPPVRTLTNAQTVR